MVDKQDFLNKTHLAGFLFLKPVRVSTTTPGSLSSDYCAGKFVDEIELKVDDRILIRHGVEYLRGIYTVQETGHPVPTEDCPMLSKTAVGNEVVAVLEGASNSLETMWYNGKWSWLSVASIMAEDELMSV